MKGHPNELVLVQNQINGVRIFVPLKKPDVILTSSS